MRDRLHFYVFFIVQTSKRSWNSKSVFFTSFHSLQTNIQEHGTFGRIERTKMDPPGPKWTHMDPHGSKWIQMDPNGIKWTHMGRILLWREYICTYVCEGSHCEVHMYVKDLIGRGICEGCYCEAHLWRILLWDSYKFPSFKFQKFKFLKLESLNLENLNQHVASNKHNKHIEMQPVSHRLNLDSTHVCTLKKT